MLDFKKGGLLQNKDYTQDVAAFEPNAGLHLYKNLKTQQAPINLYEFTYQHIASDHLTDIHMPL